MSRFEAEKLATGGLAPLSFALDEGEALIIRGASGVGKTRTLRALADLDAHTGAVRLAGIPQHEMPADRWRRRVTLVPAESAWWLDTAAAHFNGWPLETLKKLQLDASLGTSAVSRLSSGERARLSVLRAWQHRPDVLLIDEPGVNLDRDNRNRLEALLDEWRREHGLILVCASHDAELHRRLNARQLTVRRRAASVSENE